MGTNTLRVDGQATATPRLPDAVSPSDFDTELSVRIELGGAAVTTGRVQVTSATERALARQRRALRRGLCA